MQLIIDLLPPPQTADQEFSSAVKPSAVRLHEMFSHNWSRQPENSNISGMRDQLKDEPQRVENPEQLLPLIPRRTR